MAIEFADRQFELVRASDVIRDGMGLELYELAEGSRDLVAEVFFFDANARFSFSGYAEDLPLELIEWFLGQARECLPPTGSPGPE